MHKGYDAALIATCLPACLPGALLDLPTKHLMLQFVLTYPFLT